MSSEHRHRKRPAARRASPPAGKRNERRKAARPAEIIDAALAEFGERGFAGARLVDVAARAGVVKGTIYRYFDTKEALFEAVVRSRLIAAFDELTTVVDHHDGPVETLMRDTLTKLYRRFLNRDTRVLMKIIISEGARFPPLSEFYHREFIAKGKTLIARMIRRGVERGEFHPDAPVDAPLVVIAPIIATAIWQISFDDYEPIDVEETRRAHLDTLFRGLRAD